MINHIHRRHCRILENSVLLCGLLILSCCSPRLPAQHLQTERRALSQKGCPLVVISARGASLVLENTSSQPIKEYTLACFRPVRKGFRAIDMFPPSCREPGAASVAGQCSIGGPGVPSDQWCTTTKKVVSRACGSFAAITGEPGRFAPQLFATSPAA